MAYKVSLSPSARRDLEEIARYISQDAPNRAIEMARLLIDKSKLIGLNPEMGRIVPEIGNPLIREIIVRDYRVIYRVDHERDKLQIVRFWHGRRGTPKLLS